MNTVTYSKDPKYHDRTKYIDVRFHYIQDIVAQKEVVLKLILTSRMMANPLTKVTTRDIIWTYVRSLGFFKL